MSEQSSHLTQKRLRSPRAAAIAGLVFSLLMVTITIIFHNSFPTDITEVKTDWLENYKGAVYLAIGLVPIAGISFLWFMGVARDLLGHLEDQFFSTIFFGSGLLFLGGLFVWMTIIASVLASHAAASDTWIGSGAYIFGRSMIKVMGGVVTLRMAGVFMISSGTIWMRTEVMPRWLIWLTYLMALVLLIGGATLRPLRLGFPIWVFMVNLFILRISAQRAEDEDNVV